MATYQAEWKGDRYEVEINGIRYQSDDGDNWLKRGPGGISTTPPDDHLFDEATIQFVGGPRDGKEVS